METIVFLMNKKPVGVVLVVNDKSLVDLTIGLFLLYYVNFYDIFDILVFETDTCFSVNLLKF